MTLKEASGLLSVTRKVVQQWGRRGVLLLASGSGKKPAFYLFERATLIRQLEE